jgi:hypothetical protein
VQDDAGGVDDGPQIRAQVAAKPFGDTGGHEIRIRRAVHRFPSAKTLPQRVKFIADRGHNHLVCMLVSQGTNARRIQHIIYGRQVAVGVLTHVGLVW